jgi:cyclic-di-AMP phosphodiesterase PgpH
VRRLFATDSLLRIALAIVAAVSMFIILRGWEPPFPYREGFVPARSIMARVAFKVEDKAKTAVLRSEKRRTTLCFYENQPRPLVQLRSTITGMILPLRTAQSVEDLDSTQRQTLQQLLPNKDGEVEFSAEQALLAIRSLLAQEDQIDKFSEALTSVLDPLKGSGILKTLEHSPEEGDQRLINVFTAGEADQAITEPVAKVRYAEISAQLPQQVIDKFQQTFGKPEALTVAKMVNSYLIPNLPTTLKYDRMLSEAARRKVDEAVPEATTEYAPNATALAIAGQPLTASVELPLLQAEHSAWLAQRGWMDAILRSLAFGGMIAALYLLCGIYMYYQIDHSFITDTRKLCSLLGLILLTALLCKFMASDPWRAEIAPLVMCAITATIAYGRQISLLITTCIALATTLALGFGLGEFVFLASGTCSAVLLLGRIRSRTKLIYVGLAAGSIVALTHLGVSTLLGQVNGSLAVAADTGLPDPSATTWHELLPMLLIESARVGVFTLLASAFMTSVLPFVEWFFAVQTDSSLLELGDASHPLLRQLAQRAPGTYNHSINVAAIAEAAADAIGAHGLLTRVGAYFHDIGKIFKPNYFVENQGQGGNRHESLQPAMSTLVIIAHVKDGADLARQHKLPRPIIDFIEQHHGTTLVEYFYREATKRSQQDPHGEVVSETSYRYPGPKPQTLEAAVLMLADSVESASRSLVEPTSSRIQNLVEQMAMKRLLDGQFDECGLTLKQLDLIKASLVKSLNAIYHGRIKYPGQQSA